MDKVILKDFEVVACHGVNPEEKIKPQRFLFTAELFTDFSECAENDDLTQTISYSAVKKTLKSFCENNCFDLIETLAKRSAVLLLKTYPLASAVTLTVKKPDAPMSGTFDYVAVTTEAKWHEAYLALGSSEGDKDSYLDFAVSALESDDNFKDIVESERMQSEPYGGVANNTFTNSVVKCKTLYEPHRLLSAITEIEKKGGRVRNRRWADRTLDIDVVFYDDDVISDNDLCVPHIDMQNRLFVLKPLCELCPNKVHPLLGKRVAELLDVLKKRRS